MAFLTLKTPYNRCLLPDAFYQVPFARYRSLKAICPHTPREVCSGYDRLALNKL